MIVINKYDLVHECKDTRIVSERWVEIVLRLVHEVVQVVEISRGMLKTIKEKSFIKYVRYKNNPNGIIR